MRACVLCERQGIQREAQASDENGVFVVAYIL